MTRYIATVHLVFEADSDAEAADAVSAMLTENLMHSTDEPGGKPPLVDWGYLNDGKTYCHPAPMPAGAPADLEDVYLTPYAPTANAMVSAVNLVRDLSRMVTPRDPDQIADYCKEYGKDPADMTEDDLEEMESDLENDRVWSDALASYQMIRSAREIVKALTMAARKNDGRDGGGQNGNQTSETQANVFTVIYSAPWHDHTCGFHWHGKASDPANAILRAVASELNHGDIDRPEMTANEAAKVEIIWLCAGPLPTYIHLPAVAPDHPPTPA